MNTEEYFEHIEKEVKRYYGVAREARKKGFDPVSDVAIDIYRQSCDEERKDQAIGLDEVEEIGRNYGQYKNLAGIFWHEVDCCEAVDNHDDDVEAFASFCKQRFGEKYFDECFRAFRYSYFRKIILFGAGDFKMG